MYYEVEIDDWFFFFNLLIQAILVNISDIILYVYDRFLE